MIDIFLAASILPVLWRPLQQISPELPDGTPPNHYQGRGAVQIRADYFRPGIGEAVDTSPGFMA
jgi:hypothetical protein